MAGLVNSTSSPAKMKKNESALSNQNPGDFSNFPEISKKTVDGLMKRGIVSLFPV